MVDSRTGPELPESCSDKGVLKILFVSALGQSQTSPDDFSLSALGQQETLK